MFSMVCADQANRVVIALRHRPRIVAILVASILVFVIVALRRSGGPSVTYTLLEGKTDNEAQPTYSPVEHQIGDGTQLIANLTEAMYRRLVVVTAFSSNHFREALDMIGSVQKYLPHVKIIIFDLGLTAKEKGNVAEFCNVELRSFNFSKYPSYVKKLSSYAWKPLILQDLIDEKYDVILYGDSSLRMKTHNISTALHWLLDFPFLGITPGRTPIISLTHDKMIEHFQFPPSRQSMAHWGTVLGGCWFMLVNNITREKLIAPWIDCALHEECIAPRGARTLPCYFSRNAHNDGTYIGCHRFDQSALNIILAKHFGLQFWDKVGRREATDGLATVVRRPEGIYTIKHCPQRDQLNMIDKGIRMQKEAW